MALLSTYLFDACRLSNLITGGRPAWRAARWQPAQYALDQVAFIFAWGGPHDEIQEKPDRPLRCPYLPTYLPTLLMGN